MKKENLRSVTFKGKKGKFHLWLIREKSDKLDDRTEIDQNAVALVELQNGTMHVVEAGYLQFID